MNALGIERHGQGLADGTYTENSDPGANSIGSRKLQHAVDGAASVPGDIFGNGYLGRHGFQRRSTRSSVMVFINAQMAFNSRDRNSCGDSFC